MNNSNIVADSEIEIFIVNLTTLAMIFGESPPEKLLSLINVPAGMDAEVAIYYRFVFNAVKLLSGVKEGTQVQELFKQLLEEEKKLVAPDVLKKELSLYMQNRELVQSHFQNVLHKQGTQKQLAVRGMAVKGLLLQCEVVCNSATVIEERLDAIKNLSTILKANATVFEAEDLRTMISFLVQRLIPKEKDSYEKMVEVRIELVRLIAHINDRFFAANKAVWLRLKRYTGNEEKIAVIKEIGYNPFQ